MQIELTGRNTAITEDLQEYCEKRFRKIGAQVSELARLELCLCEEQNPAIADKHVAKATLHLKGVSLHAEDTARDTRHAIHLCEQELARQVKRHREKRRKRREAHAMKAAETYGAQQAAF